MEFSVGNKIKYVFPHSSNNVSFFIGIIEYVGDTFFTVRDKNKVMLKISFKNYDQVELIEELDNSMPLKNNPI